MNRIGFQIPAGYLLKDHILWSQNGRNFTSVSGTDDVSGVTPHDFTIRVRKDGRFALRCYVKGMIRSYSGNPMSPDKIFENAEEAMYFATWHSEDLFAKSL